MREHVTPLADANVAVTVAPERAGPYAVCVTVEARLAFLFFFFAIWSLVGLVPWSLAAVLVRGRGALPALPLALAGACLGGLALPLLGFRDATGLLLSLPAAVTGAGLSTAAGIRLARRLGLAGPPPKGRQR